MDNPLDKKFSRRTFIKSAAIMAGAAAIPGVALRTARADSKLPQAAVQYQDHPKDGKECSGCMHFIPGKTPKSMGACKVVQGSISPKGYCVAYVPKK
ncbi:MAG TPA: iron oxidase [Gammaproteobacteria bacterium]|jgi:hypothetical protein|nr:iron oxidase [Gammaproteobacteria bacterium]